MQDTNKEWKPSFGHLLDDLGMKNVREGLEIAAFIEKLISKEKESSFLEGVQFGRALEETETEAAGSHKRGFQEGRQAALREVEEKLPARGHRQFKNYQDEIRSLIQSLKAEKV